MSFDTGHKALHMAIKVFALGIITNVLVTFHPELTVLLLVFDKCID